MANTSSNSSQIAQAIYQQVTLTNSPESLHTTSTIMLIRCLWLNRTLFQRNAVYLTSIFAGAFAFEVYVASRFHAAHFGRKDIYMDANIISILQCLWYCLQQDLGHHEPRCMFPVFRFSVWFYGHSWPECFLAPMEGYPPPVHPEGRGGRGWGIEEIMSRKWIRCFYKDGVEGGPQSPCTCYMMLVGEAEINREFASLILLTIPFLSYYFAWDQ